MDQLEDETQEEKQYVEMQDGEIVPVYGYYYTGTVNIWTEDGIVNSGVITSQSVESES